ncbi:MAG TPA: zf-HC2 domain-containing protein [Actinomycetes bacterium]|nr:zf-HC2 domain-containing protein [Actinomycetes bacterium]
MTDDWACRNVVELLTAYLEGALDDATAASISSHLAECPGCDRYLEQLKLTIALTGELAQDERTPLSATEAAELTTAFRATFGDAS